MVKTADLVDEFAADLSFVHLPFRRFGRRGECSGPAQTVLCFEDNSVVRAQLETPGEGRVLVVDGGGSTRVALVGDMLAGFAKENGWAGVVLNGAIRDSAEIDEMDVAVFALGTTPMKSAKRGWGEAGCPIAIGGTRICAGDWVYADGDGVLVSARKLG